MADVIKKATNRFTKGLVMDFSPENTNNELLTNALNATLLTFNGNELSLQNDMGNARVETAYLPEGYIPVGTCEYGGIIYIVSYNPLEDKSQIGCFPSPERNISSKELGKEDAVITANSFCDGNGGIKNVAQYALLKDDNLNPGDKFLICASDSIYDERISDLWVKQSNGSFNLVDNPIISLNVVSIEDSGKIIYLNSDIRKYDINHNGKTYKYHIAGEMTTGMNQSSIDPDTYRNIMSSGYSVFKSKTSGKLAILAELLTIDSYSVTHSLVPVKNSESGKIVDGEFDVIIHTDVTPKVTKENENIVPKLKYYYLHNSQGYLQTFDIATDSTKNKTLYNDTTLNSDFFNTKLSDIYVNTVEDLDLNQYLNESDFNFPKPKTYHVGDSDYLDYSDVILANIKLPEIVHTNGLDLPFKYDYTLVPCMSFGRLDHLSVSNTVDFSKLHAFNQSNFNTWKYRIDGSQLRLTFGADIFDTYETDKVDGLILEFYDLWGFAGSIEINDKKSYSGVFTKIIPLNSLQALSKNRILNNEYSTNYKRNVNVLKKENGEFSLNNTVVTYKDNEYGWEISDLDNDCGTLYSNILYGVKTYLRRTINKGSDSEVKEFIRKDDFFLYTLPIYNDFYFSINNFNTLTNPQLDLMLTYKLKDNSVKEVYSNSDTIIDGYQIGDGDRISEYTSGFYPDKDLSVVRYYSYTGTSNLFLEIGLKEEYQNFNISYSPDINNYYSSTLEVLSDTESKVFTVKYDDEDSVSSEQALNYTEDSGLTLQVNKIGFNDSYVSSMDVSSQNFRLHNFININEGVIPTPIALKYEWIVGYKVSVSDIRTTEVPTTTVCALCHHNGDDDFNYSDFGVYLSGEMDNPKYLSENMFYNGGTAYKELFGLCRQMKTSGENMADECQITAPTETSAQDLKIAGKLNAGEPLKQVVSKIGKLTFCQPHAHALSENNGVNIFENGSNLGISPYVDKKYNYKGEESSKGDHYEKSKGMRPSRDLYNNPKYNLSLNTKEMIDYYGEFISTIQYETMNGNIIGYVPSINTKNHPDKDSPEIYCKMRKYVGFTGDQVERFNKCMIETMKNVYAYNPDYDSLEVNVGNVSIFDKKVQFLSNLINKNSSLNFTENKSFNDFIYLGPICFSDYINNLQKYSGVGDSDIIKINETVEENTKLKAQLQFIPGLDYCGTKENPILITSLTYNTPVPYELEDELSFKSSDIVVVKHSDNTRDFLKGLPNKKTLYGYNKDYKKLIQLDVSNYTINSDGVLNLKEDVTESEIEDVIIFNDSSKVYFNDKTWSYTTDVPVKFIDGEEDTKLKLTFKLHNPFIFKHDNRNIYLSGSSLNFLSPQISVTAEDNNDYQIKINNLNFNIGCRQMFNDKITFGSGYGNKPGLADQSTLCLDSLLQSNSNVALLYPDKTTKSGNSNDYGINPSNITYTGPNEKGNYIIECTSATSESSFYFYKLSLNSIKVTISRLSSLQSSSDSIIRVAKHNDYFKIKNQVYEVDTEKYPNTCLRGTSLTINDLRYENNVNGHRLYVRSNCWNSDGDPRNILYYREMNKGSNHAEAVASWEVEGYEHKNHLYLLTGPCFTTI